MAKSTGAGGRKPAAVPGRAERQPVFGPVGAPLQPFGDLKPETLKAEYLELKAAGRLKGTTFGDMRLEGYVGLRDPNVQLLNNEQLASIRRAVRQARVMVQTGKLQPAALGRLGAYLRTVGHFSGDQRTLHNAFNLWSSTMFKTGDAMAGVAEIGRMTPKGRSVIAGGLNYIDWGLGKLGG